MLRGLLGFDPLQIWPARKCFLLHVSQRGNRETLVGKRVCGLIHGIHRNTHRGIQLGSGEFQIAFRANEFLFAARQADLGGKQVRLHDQPAVESHLAAVHDRLRRLLRLFGDLHLLCSKENAVVGLYNAEQNLLVGTFQLVGGGGIHLLGTTDRVPRSKGIEQVPGSTETGAEVPIWQRGIQLVQGEVIHGETLLPKLATKHIDGIVTPCRRF